MLSLAFETSGPLGSAALGRGGDLLGEVAVRTLLARSEALLEAAEGLFSMAGCSAGDVERIVVGSGPGSFTGVRIAASMAKGWCHSTGATLCPVSSLRAVGAQAGAGKAGPAVCAMFDARRGDVFASAWPDGSWGVPLFENLAGPVESVLNRIAARGGGARPGLAGWCFAGRGALQARSLIAAGGGTVLGPVSADPRASTLLWIAHKDPDRGVADPGSWTPEYGRESGAVREAERAESLG